MTFDEFKKEVLKTGIPFSIFTDKGFCDSYIAEVPTKGDGYIGLYYPNTQGGVTLVTGRGRDRKIQFYNSLDEVQKWKP